MFEPLPARLDFPQAEKKVLEFWDKHDVFAESIRIRDGAPRFVFYEGPPTANGLPHPGHCLTRVMKDIFPRYRTMTGHKVERKGGWDTHGLPVEREVCKELGLKTKADIEAYGVEKFNLKCIQSVFRYTREWEEMTRRLAYWVDLKEAYVTFHQSYVESVWWSLKTLFERGVLYQGHKVVWWWAQGGTALSSGEVGEGYKAVDDPSVFVKFPVVQTSGLPRRDEQSGTLHYAREGIVPERTSLLVWTTTPWTLISNHFAAVHPDLEYALVHDPVDDEYLYIAAALVNTIAKKVKRELRVVSTCKGSDLIGRNYIPPFDTFSSIAGPRENPSGSGRFTFVFGSTLLEGPVFACRDGKSLGETTGRRADGSTATVGWRILDGNFVTVDSGSGVVHLAPAFGEVDFDRLRQEREAFTPGTDIPVLCAVEADGTFADFVDPKYRGRWVKDCDKEIVRELRDERKTPWRTPLLYHQEQYRHDYPFCPQSPEDPLIQYARASWFVRTSAFKDEFLKNNAAVNWLPEHIKEGRFGDFLRNNVDWALSRERYWGTPLPIWKCESCGRMEAIGSFAELTGDAERGIAGKPGATDGGYWERKVAEHKGEEFPTHLRVHKPYIDEWTYECTACAGDMGTKGQGEKGAARMRRVSEVIDCWWDAGSMPFAQWGFPHKDGSVVQFSQRFPADFISEAIDQTRGWFYGLLAISTLLFRVEPEEEALARQAGAERASSVGEGSTETQRSETRRAVERWNDPAWPIARFRWPTNPQVVTQTLGPHPYRTCIVLGHIAGEDGNKMSKKLRNYKEPSYIFDTLGADAMRWYFLSAQAPWTSTRFAEAAIRDSQREFLVKLYNVLSFFTIYASIDGFDPREVTLHFVKSADGFEAADKKAAGPVPMGWRPSAERTELDRWIITYLRSTVSAVRESMDRFENYPAAQKLNDFVDALSNWYVRRSRDRFWKKVTGDAAADQEKWDGYHTLYGCLRVLSQMIAPFTPFFAETMHQTLRILDDPISVHLCNYPRPEDIRYSDETLLVEMDMVREIASLGRAGRASATVKEAKKVRQPLARVEIVLARHEHEEWLRRHSDLIAEELNVKAVEFTTEADEYVTYKVVPNFKAIGEKYRALVPKIKAALGALTDAAAARKQLVADGKLPLTIDGQTVDLTPNEVEIRLDAKPGWAAAQGRVGVVVLSTEITPELRDEGLVREFIHHVQAMRKERELAYEARIKLFVDAPAALAEILKRFSATIQAETLATGISFVTGHAGEPTTVDVEGQTVRLWLEA